MCEVQLPGWGPVVDNYVQLLNLGYRRLVGEVETLKSVLGAVGEGGLSDVRYIYNLVTRKGLALVFEDQRAARTAALITAEAQRRGGIYQAVEKEIRVYNLSSPYTVYTVYLRDLAIEFHGSGVPHTCTVAYEDVVIPERVEKRAVVRCADNEYEQHLEPK